MWRDGNRPTGRLAGKAATPQQFEALLIAQQAREESKRRSERMKEVWRQRATKEGKA